MSLFNWFKAPEAPPVAVQPTPDIQRTRQVARAERIVLAIASGDSTPELIHELNTIRRSE